MTISYPPGVQLRGELTPAHERILKEYADQPISCVKALREISELHREAGRADLAKEALRRLLKEYPAFRGTSLI